MLRDVQGAEDVSFFDMVPAASPQDVAQGRQYQKHVAAFVDHNALRMSRPRGIGDFRARRQTAFV